MPYICWMRQEQVSLGVFPTMEEAKISALAEYSSWEGLEKIPLQWKGIYGYNQPYLEDDYDQEAENDLFRIIICQETSLPFYRIDVDDKVATIASTFPKDETVLEQQGNQYVLWKGCLNNLFIGWLIPSSGPSY